MRSHSNRLRISLGMRRVFYSKVVRRAFKFANDYLPCYQFPHQFTEFTPRLHEIRLEGVGTPPTRARGVLVCTTSRRYLVRIAQPGGSLQLGGELRKRIRVSSQRGAESGAWDRDSDEPMPACLIERKAILSSRQFISVLRIPLIDSAFFGNIISLLKAKK